MVVGLIIVGGLVIAALAVIPSSLERVRATVPCLTQSCQTDRDLQKAKDDYIHNRGALTNLWYWFNGDPDFQGGTTPKTKPTTQATPSAVKNPNAAPPRISARQRVVFTKGAKN